MILINGIIIIILVAILYEDFRERAIHWVLLLALAIVFITNGVVEMPVNIYLKSCLFNVCFMLLQIPFLVGYFILRGKTLKSIVKEAIGIGDVIFLIVFAFAFSQINFIVIYLTGMLFSLFVWLVFQYLSSHKNRLVPLAGLLSLYLIFIVLGDTFYKQFEMLNDSFLLNLIYE